MNQGELPFVSVQEVLDTAAFHRRMGDVGSTDERALEEALAEALASNEALREAADDLDGQAEDLADAQKELAEALDRLACDLTYEERKRGDLCKSMEADRCAECRIMALSRELDSRPPQNNGVTAELEKAQTTIEFLTAERNQLLLDAQRGVAPTKAPSRSRKAPPADQIGLFALVSPPEQPKPAEKKPRAPREKKKRRWADQATSTKAKRSRKAAAK